MSYQVSNNGFFIKSFILDNIDGTTISLDNYVQDVLIRKRFVEDSFPLFVIDLRTTEAIRNRIRDHDVKFYLRISMYKNDIETTTDENDSSEQIETEKIFEGLIRLYDKPYEATAAKVEEENQDTSNSQVQAAPFVEYRVFGIPEELISKNEEIVNYVFKQCELADALVYILSKVDTESNMYIQETTNKTIESNILVPPVSLIPAIHFLDKTYEHFYKHPPIIFYDLEGFFMFDPIQTNIQEKNLIEINVTSTTNTADLEKTSKPQVDENGNIKITYRNIPSFSESEEISKHILGSNTTFYYYDDNFNIRTRELENKESYNKVRYLWAKSGDRSDEGLFINKSIQLIISDINPNLLNPLTKIKLLSTEHPKITGEYGLGEVSIGFISNDMKHYSMSSHVSAYKKER